MKIRVVVEVEAPEGATHYGGELTGGLECKGCDRPSWYKRVDIGVVGEHWFKWNEERKAWFFCGHYHPHWVKDIPSN